MKALHLEEPFRRRRRQHLPLSSLVCSDGGS